MTAKKERDYIRYSKKGHETMGITTKDAISFFWRRMKVCGKKNFQYKTIREHIKMLIKKEKFCNKFSSPQTVIVFVMSDRIFAVFPHPEAGKPHHRINYMKTRFFR